MSLYKKFLLVVLFSFFAIQFLSCAGPKYTYYYESGKYLDFRTGKWILNETKANKRFVDIKLYNLAKEEFQKILGDSLVEIHGLRWNRVMAPTISFDLDRDALIELGEVSGCDYLINIEAKVLSSGVGAITIPTDISDDYARNESTVAIKIYYLPEGLELSSATANALLEEQGTVFDKKRAIPTINSSSETAALQATKKLIRKYSKYQFKGERL